MSNPIVNLTTTAPEKRTIGQINEPLPSLVLDDRFKSFLKLNYGMLKLLSFSNAHIYM